MQRILIVEDKASSRELLRTVLEQQGYEVVEAHDGEQALAVIRGQALDLVLMDLQLPQRNGYDVLQEIRSNPKLAAIPVVAITANAMPEDRARALAAGFTGYISKPVALAQLRDEVNGLLRPK